MYHSLTNNYNSSLEVWLDYMQGNLTFEDYDDLYWHHRLEELKDTESYHGENNNVLFEENNSIIIDEPDSEIWFTNEIAEDYM